MRSLDRIFRARAFLQQKIKKLSDAVRKLFSNGEQGVWYDPSDLTTLYQDAAGTTPVTAVEQPVGLMLDKSKGLVLGPELVTNGDFSNGTTGWTKSGTGTIQVVNGRLRITGGDTSSFTDATQAFQTVAGKTYRLNISGYPGTAGRAYMITPVVAFFNEGYSCFFTAAATTTTILLRAATGSGGYTTGYAEFDNISVRELPGNHATQTTSTSRPVLSARYNLLTKTEQFDDAAWYKSSGITVTKNDIIAPNGTLTANKVVFSSANQELRQTITSSGVLKGSLYIKGTPGQTIALGDGLGISGTTVTLNGNWQLITYTTTATSQQFDINTYGVTARTVWVWGADLRVANDGVGLPPYQRVNTATDYDTVGFPHYLRFDGIDDFLVTNSIDFTATNKMFVSAGVRKLSDVDGIISELSQNFNSYNGSFYFASQPLGKFGSSSRGAATGSVPQEGYSSGYYAPVTAVLSALHDISGDLSILRVNGIAGINGTGDKGAGNFGNYPLYIGARAGSSILFNGHLYQLVVRGAQSTDQQIIDAEKYVNSKTKAYV